MGKRSVFVILVLLSKLTIFGQISCDQNFIKVKEDTLGCKTVEMGSYKFSEFYYNTLKLKEIQDSLPKLKDNLSRERKLTDSIESNLETEIDTSMSSNRLIKANLADCNKELIKTQINNLRLIDVVKKEKKNNKRYFILGAVSVIVLNIIINSIE